MLDLYWFQVRSVNGYRCDQSSDLLNVCPVGFLPSRFDLANVEYRLRKQGEQPWLLAWRDALVRTQDAADSFLSPETLTLSPRLN